MKPSSTVERRTQALGRGSVHTRRGVSSRGHLVVTNAAAPTRQQMSAQMKQVRSQMEEDEQLKVRRQRLLWEVIARRSPRAHRSQDVTCPCCCRAPQVLMDGLRGRNADTRDFAAANVKMNLVEVSRPFAPLSCSLSYQQQAGGARDHQQQAVATARHRHRPAPVDADAG